MHSDTSRWVVAARALALFGIFVAGLISLVGSGGGGGDGCGIFSDGCVVFGQDIADAFVSPLRVTVPVGGSVTFTATTTAPGKPFSVQWKRSRDGGATYAAIPGATSASLTIAGAQLPDDDSWFLPDVSIPDMVIIFPTQPAHLHVSSMPGVEFADGEFQDSDWSVTAAAAPSASGPTFSDMRSAAGGNPDAFRSMTYSFPAGSSSLQAIYASRTGVYDPATLGAIYTIDFSQDCIVTNVSASIGSVQVMPSIEQAGRRYVPAQNPPQCSIPRWYTADWPSLAATDLIQVDGPACGQLESCPDFSATGKPLTFGYARRASQGASAPAGTIVHGIDNWKVTVWRH